MDVKNKTMDDMTLEDCVTLFILAGMEAVIEAGHLKRFVGGDSELGTMIQGWRWLWKEVADLG